MPEDRGGQPMQPPRSSEQKRKKKKKRRKKASASACPLENTGMLKNNGVTGRNSLKERHKWVQTTHGVKIQFMENKIIYCLSHEPSLCPPNTPGCNPESKTHPHMFIF